MSQTLPQGIVTRVTALVTDLVTWAQRHPEASLAEQEAQVLHLLRELAPDLLLALLPLSVRELHLPVAGQRQECPQCRARCGVQEWRPRVVATRCGEVRYERPWYWCRACQHGWAPADQVLAVEPYQRVSAGLDQWLIALGATTDFREAAALLEELTGLHLAPETVRQHTERAGATLEAAQQRACATVMASREPAEPVAPAPGQLLVEADGVMVRYTDDWHEVKVGLVGGHAEGKTQGLSYVAAREGPDAFGPRLLTEAARRGVLDVVGWTGPLAGKGLAQLRPVVVIGDGAHWIWNLAAEHFGERTEMVDFYHASEHLWEVARMVYGAGTAEAAAWAEAQRAALRHFGAAPVLAALAALPAPSPEAQALVKREQGYFRSNQARMDYPAFRARGLPIGSGAVESSAKYVVQLRMKRPGSRWSDRGAHGVLMVRTYRLSGRPWPSSPAAKAA
jgi:hypothetical protein